MLDHAIVTRDPIDPEALVSLIADTTFGAIATFLGLVRSPNKGKVIVHIDYEGYDAMMQTEIQAIAAELREDFGIGRVVISHRLGRLWPGETSVAVLVSGRHRKETLAACTSGIEKVKERLPVWKHEATTEGANWVPGTDVAGRTI
jgi:molybdopterin synthase catalytic subunit